MNCTFFQIWYAYLQWFLVKTKVSRNKTDTRERILTHCVTLRNVNWIYPYHKWPLAGALGRTYMAVTKMVLDHVWAPDFFGPREIWSPKNLVPRKFDPCMKIIICRDQAYWGPNFNFWRPKFLGDQISWGPKKSGARMRSGPIQLQPHTCLCWVFVTLLIFYFKVDLAINSSL